MFIGTTLQNLCSVDGAGHHQKELLNPRNRAQGIPPDETLISCKYDMRLNSAGSCTFVMPPKHPYILDIKPMETLVGIAEIDNIVWIGRVTDINTDFYGRITVNCEDAYAWLNDSVQPYMTYESMSKEEYLNMLIRHHNAQVYRAPDDQTCMFGVTTDAGNNDFVPNGTLNYETTMDLIQQFLSDYGGYMRAVLGTEDVTLFWTKDIPRTDVSEQAVKFGKNLLDFSKLIDYSDIFTSIIPIGEDVEMEVPMINANGQQVYTNADGTYVTITHRNGTNYATDEEGNEIQIPPGVILPEATTIAEFPLNLAMEEVEEGVEPDENGIKPLLFKYNKNYKGPDDNESIKMLLVDVGSMSSGAFGRIVRTVKFNDVYDVETLRDRALEWIKNHDVSSVSVKLTAADLRFLDESEGNLYLGMSVPVDISKLPHGFTDSLVITRIEADVVKVSKKITLGHLPKKTLSDMAGRGNNKYEVGPRCKKLKTKSQITSKSKDILFIPK